MKSIINNMWGFWFLLLVISMAMALAIYLLLMKDLVIG
jgi:hypothetical protein